MIDQDKPSQRLPWALTAGQPPTARQYNHRDLLRKTVVISPHFDDETLGCGGLIYSKRAAGADVTLVFLTDGSISHKHLMPPQQLSSVRKRESIAAANVLGVGCDDLRFLDFPEGYLSYSVELASMRLSEILIQHQPEEVLLPYRNDGHPDHVAAHRAAIKAIRLSHLEVTIYEYPIWFWNQWPWMKPMKPGRRLFRSLLLACLQWLKDFRCTLHFGDDVLAAKRSALDQYHSQMTRLIDDCAWKTLHDVSDGQFLACFLKRQELFCRRRIEAIRPAGPVEMINVVDV